MILSASCAPVVSSIIERDRCVFHVAIRSSIWSGRTDGTGDIGHDVSDKGEEMTTGRVGPVPADAIGKTRAFSIP